MTLRIRRLSLYRLRLPLHVPYRLSYHTFESFEPILVRVTDEDGGLGWGEGHISPGSSQETRTGGWAFCRTQAARILGLTSEAAKAAVGAAMASSPVAAGALLVALEMLEDNPLLRLDRDVSLPLATPVDGRSEAEIEAEVARRLDQGFTTFKVKVGTDVDADLARVAKIQRALAGRAMMRLDANRAFSRAEGCRFAAALDPAGIELFEQPCAASDWEANSAVAAVSTVPLMLDEAICSLDDIERAATIAGVGFCKLKLKRFGGLERLKAALERVRELAMEPVLGDGLSSDLGCWMEACVARSTIRNAGEFNGFLKPKSGLFTEALGFEQGHMVLKAGFRPRIDPAALADKIVAEEDFALPGAAGLHAGGGGRSLPLWSAAAKGTEMRVDTDLEIRITPLAAPLGTEVSGIDVSRAVEAPTRAALIDAWKERLVLVLRGQRITDAELIAFSRNFGELDPPGPNPYGKPFHKEFPEINVISNVVEDGVPIGGLGAGEAVWHADMTYIETPPKAGILYALEVPRSGGNTYFANMYAAYDALSDDLKDRIQGRIAIHDASRNSAGMLRKGYAEVTDVRKTLGARHPLVRVDPDSGRKALFLGRRRSSYVPGLAVTESEALLDRLWAHAGDMRFAMCHEWRVGDLLIWNNLSVLHRRDPFDPKVRRIMHRTQIKGDRVVA